MSKFVAIVKHIKSEGAGSISRYLRRKNIPYKLIEVYRGGPLPQLCALKALVIMGGPMNVDETEKYPFLKIEKKYLEQALKANIPILGVCLGAQLLARAGQAEVRKNPCPEIGWFRVNLTSDGENDPLLKGVAANFPVLQWHYDTFDLPPEASLLATSPLCRNQAMRVGKHAYGLQFHIEVTPALIRSWSIDAPPPEGKGGFLESYHEHLMDLHKIANQIYDNFFSLAAGF